MMAARLLDRLAGLEEQRRRLSTLIRLGSIFTCKLIQGEKKKTEWGDCGGAVVDFTEALRLSDNLA